MILLWIAAYALASTSAATFCVSNNRMCVTTTVQGPTMLFEISTTTKGWVGLGFQTRTMTNADIIMAYTINGRQEVNNRVSVDHDLPTLNKIQQVKLAQGSFTNMAPNAKEAAAVYRFTRPIAATGGDPSVKPLVSGPMDLIWAFSSSAPVNAASASVHSDYGALKIDLFSASSYTSTTSGSSSKATVSLIHGILMFIAWSVFTPLAIFFARFMKEKMGKWWFRSHAGLFSLVAILTIAAFALMVSAKMGTKHFNSPHMAMGLVLVIFMLAQMILGMVIDRLFDPYRRHIPWYDKAHWWLGRVSAVLSVVTTFLGLAEYNTKQKDLLLGMYGAFVAVLITAFVVAQVKMGQSHHNEKKKPSDYSFNPSMNLNEPLTLEDPKYF